MATTTTEKGGFITIIWDTAVTDWVYETELPQFPNKIKVKSIQFNPSAANDVFVMREGSLVGTEIINVICADVTDQRVKYFGEGTWMKPYIEADDLTFGVLANARVTIELA